MQIPRPLLLLSALALLPRPAPAQEKPAEPAAALDPKFETLKHELDQLAKSVDDVLWYQKVGDVALVDKVLLYGPPPARAKNPTALGAKNPLKFWASVFIPQKLDRTQKHPLLIHTNTNDDDVHVLEVEHLIAALTAAGKKFDYEIFQDAPGGHSFDRMDTKAARDIRLKIYRHLGQHLKPALPFADAAALARASLR
ncbi:MAG: prolyl oligopeptidase family serine peptidase [Verrucomicrobia bacterium]|nr:prolyl oligopeptidase family serine peptidase [Verrucomicrobiota bacterium]